MAELPHLPPTQTAYFPLRGGLNLVTPPLSLPDGSCREALNFECDIDGGYRRVAGYERYDGRPAPSEAVSYLMYCTFSGSISAGDTMTGATSGASGVVTAVGSDYVAFTKYSGSFVPAENLQVAAMTQAVSTSGALAATAPSQLLVAAYRNLAADQYRADIGALPGSGATRGVWRYNGSVYGWRDNAGATAGVMHKASASGWVALDLGHEISFSNANTAVEAGDTLTQGGVTAAIKRVVVESGSLASGVNSGRLILGTPAGGNFAGGAATSSGGGALTLGGVQTAISLPAGGSYEFINQNFGGSANSTRMYGCNGVGRAFEFDSVGDVFVPLNSGMTTDIPSHISAHRNYLFLSFAGSVQRSSIGTPYMWTPITGAGEIAMGDTVTGFLPMIGSDATAALAIFTTNKTSILYGASEADFNLITFSYESGGFPATMQSIGQAYVMDELGIHQISATQAFGNFNQAQITKQIRPFISARVAKTSGSCIVRLRNQYRLFFNDRYALHITFDNGKIVGMLPVQHAHTFTCFASHEGGDGDEWILAGDTNGYVYRMERGTSFDGEDIIAYINLAFAHQRSPRSRKRYRKVAYEITGGGYTEFDASYELGYGNSEINQGVTSALTTPFGGAFWDELVFDTFYWDGRTLLPAEQDVTGTAENISLTIRSTSDYFEPFTVNSAIIHYTPRRQMR